MIQAAIIGLGKIGLLFDIPLKAVPQSHALAYHLHPEIDLIAAVGVRPEQGAGAISEVKVIEQVPTSLDDKQDWSYSFLFKMKDQSAGGYAQAYDDRNYNIFELELYFEKGKIEYLHAGDEIRFYSVREHPVQKGLNMLKQDEVLEGLAGKASSIVLAVEHVKNIVESAAAPICTLEDGIYPLCVANALIESHQKNGSWETIEIPGL